MLQLQQQNWHHSVCVTAIINTSSKFQVPKGAGRLLHRPVDLDLDVGPSAIPCEIPVITGYLMRICGAS